jgi:hypothetical protein
VQIMRLIHKKRNGLFSLPNQIVQFSFPFFALSRNFDFFVS